MSAEPNSIVPETNPTKKSSFVWKLLLLALLATGAAFVWFKTQSQYTEAESAARTQLQALGGIVLSGSRKHVGSVNLALVKDQQKFDEAITLVKDCRWLENLDLSNTPVTDEQLLGLRHLRRLTSLQLAKTNIGDKGVTGLTGLPRLSALHLSRTQLTSDGLDHLAKIGSLNILDISETKISGDLAPLRKLKKLTWLVVRELALEDGAVDTFIAMPALGRVALNSEQLSEEQQRKLKRGQPRLMIDTPELQEALQAAENGRDRKLEAVQ